LSSEGEGRLMPPQMPVPNREQAEGVKQIV
jgi:hypothetical protein